MQIIIIVSCSCAFILSIYDYNNEYDNIEVRMQIGWIMVGPDLFLTCTFLLNVTVIII